MSSNTPLLNALSASGTNAPSAKASAKYRGTTIAAHFGDPQAEFSALSQGCGIYDMGFRGRISVTGGDRVRWMNGMVTNNVRDLAPGHGVYAFLLNPQGRILADMQIFNRGDSLLVETDRSQVEKIMATFDHFIIMDDVEIADVSDRQTALGLSGPKSRQLLNAVGIKVPEMKALEFLIPHCECNCQCTECTVIRGEDGPQESYEIWLDSKDAYQTWKTLVSAGASPAGSGALEMQRIACGIPLYGVDIRERDLPQETEQMRALNFNKGCYVGQEIVERIRSRGNVHRKFTGLLAKGSAQIDAGAKLFSGEKEVGEVTSAAVLGTGAEQRNVALGYLRREVATPGREVMIGNEKAIVVQLPLAQNSLQPADDAILHRV